MKNQHLIVTAGIGLVLVMGVALLASRYWGQKQPFQDSPKLIAALQAFSRDQTALGRPLPEEVSLQDLLAGGYLTPKDVSAFKGIDLVLSTRYNQNSPQNILARARMPDGQVICLMFDGSVQQFTPQRYEAYRAEHSRSNGTNQAPSAAPSR